LVAYPTRGDVPLVFCGGGLCAFQRNEFGVVTLIPTVLAILRVALMFRRRYFVCFRERQMGMIAQANTILAVAAFRNAYDKVCAGVSNLAQ
jgi:hypothetical protein